MVNEKDLYEKYDPRGGGEPVSILSVENVSHAYDKKATRYALRDIDLSIAKNEIVALVGESGCGKTTLGKIFSGLITPTQGTVKFGSTDLSTMKRKDFEKYRRSVQLVHQDPYASLNPALTIYETLSSGVSRHKLVPRSELTDYVRSLLDRVGLLSDSDVMHRYPHQLSGGQRQRIGIARALALQPQVIVADEAVSMLDVSMRVSILDLLLKLKEDEGLSYLFISHDFGVVRYFAGGSRIAVLYFGTVVEEGICEEIIEHPQHPYTYVLLSAVPVPDPRLSRSRTVVTLAEVDETGVDKKGCVFERRCPFANKRCQEEVPPLRNVEENHRVACFYPERIPRN